jgi:hypothetical protein
MRPEDWPTWWKGVLFVELLAPGDADGLGAYRRMAWRKPPPIHPSFSTRESSRWIDPVRLKASPTATCRGRGKWTLSESFVRHTRAI